VLFCAYTCRLYNRTIVVHTGAMSSASKTVRQRVTLPAKTAAQVRTMAKARTLTSKRMLVELIENGIEGEKRKQQEFFELADRFRNATDPEEAERLGEEMGRMVFGSGLARRSHHPIFLVSANKYEESCHSSGSTKSNPKDLKVMFAPRCGAVEILRFAEEDNDRGKAMQICSLAVRNLD
jgi:hypothetical protein